MALGNFSGGADQEAFLQSSIWCTYTHMSLNANDAQEIVQGKWHNYKPLKDHCHSCLRGLS